MRDVVPDPNAQSPDRALGRRFRREDFTVRPDAFAAMPGAAAADGPIAIVPTVGTAKPNVKKYPVSSRRFSVIDHLRYATRGRSRVSKPSRTSRTPEQAVPAIAGTSPNCARAARDSFNCEYQRRKNCRSFQVSRCRSPRRRQQCH